MKQPHLVFVYNAAGNIFSRVMDFAHKILSPGTYQCQLCALTYGDFTVKNDWKVFIERLNTVNEFLHKDELERKYGIGNIPLPAILYLKHGRPETLLSAPEINQCKTLDDLKRLVSRKLNELQ